jgi:dTDP-4-dehydrorhamnose reductase
MRILITGANGFLGYYLTEKLLQKKYGVIATGKGACRLPFNSYDNFIYNEMDFTDPFSVHDVFEKHKPDVVVHAGAISKVDDCELNQWEAFKANTEATVTMLVNAEEHKSFFVFVSTDFIFDGERGMYKEEDKPGPVNFYGKTKLEAEEAVKEYLYDWAIVRTVLVYGKPQAGRSNILTIVKQKLENGEVYNVVDDQVRTPTYVEDLADGIITVIEKKAKGVYHLSGDEVMTPYHMAIKAAEYLGLDATLIKRVTAKDFSQPARRPPKTGFVIDKAKKELGYKPLSFEEGLKKTFEN